MHRHNSWIHTENFLKKFYTAKGGQEVHHNYTVFFWGGNLDHKSGFFYLFIFFNERDQENCINSFSQKGKWAILGSKIMHHQNSGTQRFFKHILHKGVKSRSISYCFISKFVFTANGLLLVWKFWMSQFWTLPNHYFKYWTTKWAKKYVQEN